MKQVLLLCVAVGCMLNIALAQSVGINTDGSNPNERSILDVKSTNKGVMLPRMTSAQRSAIAVQPGDAGLIVFDLDQKSLYLYNGSQWVPLHSGNVNSVHAIDFAASDGAKDDHFGAAVAISGDMAVVGAPENNHGGGSNRGAAYIFTYNGTNWAESQKLIAHDAANQDAFGTAVAMAGDWMAIGAYLQGGTGKVYIFKRAGNSWTFTQEITASDKTSNDEFGRSIVMDQNRILVGAPRKTNGQYTNTGVAYLFLRNGDSWQQNNKLIANDPGANDNFGTALAMNANNLVIGAPRKIVNGIAGAGAAYIFSSANGQTNWIFKQRLINTQANIQELFGSAIAITPGNRILVGIPGHDAGIVEAAGRVNLYFLNGDTWGATGSIFAPELEADAQFGNALAVRGEEALAGAPMEDYQSRPNSGHVFCIKYSPDFSWQHQFAIGDTDPQPGDFFGRTLAVDPVTGRFIIGSPGFGTFAGRVSFGKLP